MSLLFFLLLPKEGNCQKNRILTSGFGMNYIYGFIPQDYGYYKGISPEFRKVSTLVGGEFGNRWMNTLTDKIAVGGRINWLEICMYKEEIVSEITYDQFFSVSETHLDVTFMEMGPVATYALGENLGVDLYYLLRPIVYDKSLRPNHSVGMAFRWNVLSLSYEYIFGKGSDRLLSDGERAEVEMNHGRLMLGLKF